MNDHALRELYRYIVKVMYPHLIRLIRIDKRRAAELEALRTRVADLEFTVASLERTRRLLQ